MTDLPLVSIITPSYNQVQYLEQTIQSVLDQDYPRVEYFVIDGASTDGSVEIIRKYEHQLAGWISEHDKGQADAINKGFRFASGELVAWLNSDDLYLPGTIRKMVSVFQQLPQVGLIYGDVLSIDENGEVFNIMRYANWGLEDLMTFHILGQAGVFMRRDALEKAGYLDTRFQFMLDHQLWLCIAQVTPMHYLPEVVAAARFHSMAKNVAQSSQFGAEAYDLVAWMEEQPSLEPIMAQLSTRIWANAHRFNARYLLDSGQPLASLRSYLRSFATHPSTALREWHRMLYAILCLLGLERLKPLYMRLRKGMITRRGGQNIIRGQPVIDKKQ
jgi:glycosyltransferase involved in cell wall biosynthesis